MAYQRYEPGEYRPQFGSFSFFPPVIKYLIIANLGVFLFANLISGGVLTIAGEPLSRYFAEYMFLWPLGEGFLPWQLISYMFIHLDFWHIFMNMLMLWMFGMEVENTWGSKKFLLFFIACGIAGGLSNLLIAPLFSSPGATIGASGGVYGVLVAFAMLFPNRYVYIYFFLPLKAKYLITGLIAIEVFYGVTGSREGVAHMAHLGGAILGAIWVLLDSRGTIDVMLRRVSSRGRTTDRYSSAGNDRMYQATVHPITPPSRTSSTSNTEFERYQHLIDEILDKIGKQGYSALTEEEKRLLLDASKRIHPDKGQNG